MSHTEHTSDPDAISPEEVGVAARPADTGKDTAPGNARWIRNEGLLRDEGVLFGLTGQDAGLEHKQAGIKSFFDGKKARIERERRRLQQEVDRLVERRDEARQQIERLEGASASAEPDVARSHPGRSALGFVLALAVCAFNYTLVLELMAPHFEQAVWVSLGVVLAGLFSLYQPVSLLFASDASQREHPQDAELWKQRLAEFGFPLTAAFFVSAWSYDHVPLPKLAATFVYLSMLFLFAGKLLLSTIPQMGQALRSRTAHRRARKEKGEWEVRIATLRGEQLEPLRHALDAVRAKLNALPLPEEVDARCRHALSVFMSEHALAKSAAAQWPHAAPLRVPADPGAALPDSAGAPEDTYPDTIPFRRSA